MPSRALPDRHPLVTFTLVTYVISWGAWTLAGTAVTNEALIAFLLVVGTTGPFLAALVLVGWGDANLRDWLRETFRLRRPPQTYLIGLAVPIVAVALAAGAHAAIFGGQLTPDLLPPVTDYPLYLVFVLLLGGGLEEPGWRGYLLPRLQNTRSSLVAAIVIGMVWAVWHLPLFLLPGTVQGEISFLLYVPQVLGLSVLLTWLTNAAGGSVVPAIFLHAGANAIVNYYPVGGVPGATSTPGHALLVAVILGIAGAVVIRYGTQLQREAPTAERPATD
ncbi:CPBP family intramembrane glutamic endopeptidase [Halobacteriales archaeon Cl-PHB]